ncbi:MAG TPA: nicotinamide riboside transporter PnuC, partial [Paludibacteraceae bacterium]|nr:nicotinamide riboside transporter PnuC [Paludibacteraceae bacterium]
VIHIPKSMILDVLAVFLVIFILYFFVLSNFTDSPVPRADSFTTALSIIATWMLARKMIENWLLFIVADGVCTGLYFYRELYPTAILFAVYTIMAIIGYFKWKRTMNREWQAKLRKKEIF